MGYPLPLHPEVFMKKIRDLLSRFGLNPFSSNSPISNDIGRFKLPVEPYGKGDTERCVEIPWAMSCYHGEQKVLDVGYAHAEERYIRELFGLSMPTLYGIDLVGKHIGTIVSVKGDIRKSPFNSSSFDLIFCISTIEHVGCDNAIYTKGPSPIDELGDLGAIEEMSRMLKRQGKIVLTVPYGKYLNYGWFIHYDEKKLDKLISASNCEIFDQDFFIYQEGWRSCSKTDLKSISYKDNGAPAAAGLACILLEKI
jgi:O-antigen chain-terminating methyltransferase